MNMTNKNTPTAKAQATDRPDALFVLDRVRRNDPFDEAHYTSTYLVGIEANNLKDDEWLDGAVLRLLKRIAQDFLDTPEGIQAWDTTCEDFNWGDIETEIPEDFLAKYHVRTHHDGMDLSSVHRVLHAVADQDEVIRPRQNTNPGPGQDGQEGEETT